VYKDDAIDQTEMTESKVLRLTKWIEDNLRNESTWNGERVLIFTEYVDTLRFITKWFEKKGWKEPTVATLSGGSSEDERALIKARFNDPSSKTRILVATDAAAEGLNLQHTCRYLIHIEVPWNPMRLEQRNGRLDRHGQQREVVAHHFISPQAEETTMLDYVARKANTVREDLGRIGNILDNALMRKFTTQTSIDEWRRDTDQHIDGLAAQLREEDEAEAFANRGGGEEQKAASAAYLSWSERFGLTEESLQRMFEYGVSLSHGSLVDDQEEGFLRWSTVPPGWLSMVDSKMVLAKGSGRLKMCFDERRMRCDGILRWRKDVALLRLGHPAMTKASKRLQRLLWDESFSRWSLEISDEISEPRFLSSIG